MTGLFADNGGGGEHAPTTAHAPHEGPQATCKAALRNHWQAGMLQRSSQRVWVCRLGSLQGAAAALAESEAGYHDRQAHQETAQQGF